MIPRELEFSPSLKLVTRMRLLVALGTVALGLGLSYLPQRLWPGLLLVSFYLISLSLAGVVLIAVQYVTGAHWGVALRRVPEAMARLLPIGAAGLLFILLFHPSLYPWVSEAHGGHEVGSFRQWWLSLPFFRARAIAYFVIWMSFIWALLRTSTQQDADGDPRHTRRAARISAAFLVVFGVTFWLASYDWVMSLEPDWYSTIFGIYNFAGLFQGGLAATTILVIWLKQRDPLSYFITRDHLHDLGKLLFAFSTFWAYLWFSQYMLIWYANIPEETIYFVRRQHAFWASLLLLDLFLNWVGPFFALLPRTNKQSPSVLVKVSVVVLLGRWLDLYLMIVPPFAPDRPPLGLWEVALAAGGLGVFMLGIFAALRKAPLVPVRDPFLSESLHYHA